jgi:archaellum component FlaC
MEMVSPYIVWNVLITLILAPIWFQIRQNSSELKRQDILINKTREEIAKEYVTKTELRDDMGLIMDRMEKISEKLDKLFEVK